MRTIGGGVLMHHTSLDDLATGTLPPLLLAQENATQAPPTPSFVFDGLLVVVLFGLAIFAICRAGRRN